MRLKCKLVITLALLYFQFTGFAQVALQTGAAEINIPLYQYNDAKTRLSNSISLVYINGNGLKVNEIASSTGTGWDILAGGFIARIQNGEPDDQKFVHVNQGAPDVSEQVLISSYSDFYYPDGYFYTPITPSGNIPAQAVFVPIFPQNVYPRISKPIFADREQDIFSFRFNGRAGEFLIGKDGSIIVSFPNLRPVKVRVNNE